MANRLAMDKSQAIKSLAATGMSERRITRTLGVSRKAVRQHLERGAPKETKAPLGEAPTGSTEPPESLADESRRLCAAYRSSILEKLEQGLTAQRIFQDLRDEQGFPGRYHSVRRYVRRPR
jgi:transposase